MIETLIAILLTLGLTFTQTEKGQISMNSDSLKKLESTDAYQKEFGTKPLSDIVVTDDDDPITKEKE